MEGVVEEQGEEGEAEEEALTPDSNGGGAGSVDSGVESPRNSASPEPPAATQQQQQQQQHSSSATNSKSPSYAKATKSFKVKQKDAIPSGAISVVKTTKSVSSSRKTSPPSSLLLQQQQELLQQEQQRPTCDAGESSVTVDDSSSTFPVDGGLEDSASLPHLCAAADEKALSSVPMSDTIGDCAVLLGEAAPESESGRSNSTVKEIDVSVGDRSVRQGLGLFNLDKIRFNCFQLF